MPTLPPVNPALAFGPANTDKELSMTIPQMCHVTSDEDRLRLEEIVTMAVDETPTWSEGLAYISRHAATPQELAFMAFVFLHHVHTRAQKNHDRKKAAIMEKLGLGDFDPENVHIIELD